MTWLESNGFLISIMFIGFSVFGLGSFTLREMKLILRNTISYKNYPKKESLFRLQPNSFRLYGYPILIGLGVILSGFYLFTNMLRIYLVILIPMIATLGFYYLQEKRITKTNLSLNKFDKYYEEIHTLIQKKSILLIEIRELKQLLDVKHNKYQDYVLEMNQFLKDKIDKSYYLKLTASITNKILGFEQDLYRYDDSISKKFNDLLKSYLRTFKILKGLDVPAIVDFSSKDIEVEIQETEETFQEAMYQDCRRWLSSNMLDHQSPVKMLRFLEPFKKDLVSFYEETFKFYDTSNQDEWLGYLEEKKLLQISFLGQQDYLKQYPWIFSPRLYQNLRTDQALELMQYVHKQDYYESALTMLLTLPLANRILLPRALAFESLQNRTTKLYRVFIDVFSQPLEFYQTTTVWFDQLMALKHYYDFEVPNPSSSASIGLMLSQENIETNQRFIESTYRTIYDGLSQTKNNAIQLLILLQEVIGSDHPWYQFGSLIGLIHEYLKTLQLEKLNILNVLLFLMISLKSQSESIYQRAYNLVEMQIMQLMKPLPKNHSQAQLIDRIRTVFTQDQFFVVVASIVSRFEQQRQVIDELLDRKVTA